MEKNELYNLLIIKVSVYKKDLNFYKDFLAKLRNAFYEYHKIPVVAIVEDFVDYVPEELLIYFDDMLYKPFDVTNFFSKIKANMKFVSFFGKFE